MKKPKFILHKGIEVKTGVVNTDRLPGGYFIAKSFLLNRRTDAVGKIMGELVGSGGSVYWVKHADKTVSAYSVSELELHGPRAAYIADYYNISSW